jgi:hypothetical protein
VHKPVESPVHTLSVSSLIVGHIHLRWTVDFARAHRSPLWPATKRPTLKDDRLHWARVRGHPSNHNRSECLWISL